MVPASPGPMCHVAGLPGVGDGCRIRETGLTYRADPYHRRPGEITHDGGGRGAYFEDPNGHDLDILTRPYGSGG